MFVEHLHPSVGAPLFSIMEYKLRDYQQQASDASVEFFMQSKVKHNGLLILPTGAGKSLVIADIASRIDEPLLILQPNKEIAEQNIAKYASYGFNEYGVYSASLGMKTICRVTFAMIGSVMNHMEEFSIFHKIIVDECHQVNAKGGQYKEFFEAEQRKIVGLTATPYRLGQSVDFHSGEYGSILKFLTRTRPRIFSKVLYYCQVKTLLERGYLAKLRYFDLNCIELDNVQVNSTGADYDDESLFNEFQRVGFYEQTLSIVKRVMRPKDYSHRNGILVFTRFVEDAERLAEDLMGFCEVVSGKTPKKEREAILERFKAGETEVLANVGVLTTGFDFPALDTIILARPTMSLALYYQMCLSMDTEVLTNRGFLKYSEIAKADKVAAYNNGTIVWTEIEDIVHRKMYDGEQFVSFANQHLNFCVTGYHELLVKRKWQDHYKKVNACDVAKMGNTIVVPVAGEQNVPDCGLKVCELKFLGFFLSDGGISKANNQIHIVQSYRYPEIIDEIERTIQDCGMKYSKAIQKRKGREAKYYDVVHFCISKGKPRGTFKDLKGWEYLSEYIDKDFGAAYEKLSSRDLSILLYALNLGDGKKSDCGYERKTYTIAMGNNKVYADRVQSLAIRRGWRCNMYTQVQNGNVQYICHFKQRDYSTIAGQNVKPCSGKERPKITISQGSRKDEVWCVKDKYGTIVTRRNGKVLIMGNCGRAIRPYPGKDGWVVDLCGSISKFGKVEDLTIEVEGKEKWIITSNGKQLTNKLFTK